jgi:hypothetical protein
MRVTNVTRHKLLHYRMRQVHVHGVQFNCLSTRSYKVYGLAQLSKGQCLLHYNKTAHINGAVSYLPRCYYDMSAYYATGICQIHQKIWTLNTGYIPHTMMWDHSHIIWTPEYRPEKPEHSLPLLKFKPMTSMHQIPLTKQQLIGAVNGKLRHTRRFQSSETWSYVVVSVVPNILNDPCALTFLDSLTLTKKAQQTFKMSVTYSPIDKPSQSRRLRSSLFDIMCTNNSM